MVSSTTRKIISLAISLLVVVISLTGVALAATAPTVTTVTIGPNGNGRYTPGFAGAPGKMARDAAGNFYVTDFWGKGVVKLNRQLSKTGFIATSGRPTAVAALADGRLVIAMSKPTAKVVFYSQTTGAEAAFGGPALFNPTGVTVDAAGIIYVVDSGNSTNNPADPNYGRVRVYDSAGTHLTAFGARALASSTYVTPGPVAGATTDPAGTTFKQPMGIEYEKEANQVVVVDTLNGRLQFFAAWDGLACNYVKSLGGTAGRTAASIGGPIKFYNPVDVAFEYNLSNALYRMYVPQRGRNEIAVVNAETAGTYGTYLSAINGTTVTGADMKLPSSVLFEKTGTTVGVGALYVDNAATATAEDILVLSVGSGSIVPTVTMTMADVPATSATSTINVSGTTSPATAVTCTVNGVASGSTIGTGSWTTVGGTALTLQTNQMNYIVCQGTSGGVTASKEAYTYYGAPTTAPTVNIATPATGVYKNAAAAAVTVSGTLTGASYANATVQITSNLGGSVMTSSDASGAYSEVLTLTTPGPNVITVTATQPWTNPGTANVTVNYDITPPNMTGTISFISDGATTTSAVQNLDALVLEANLQSITVNSVPVSAAAKVALAGNNTYFSVPVTLERGSNLVTVIATDLAGNSTTVSRTVTLAPEIPGFTVALPVDNKFRTSVGTESASGTVDPTFTSVVACGTSATLAGNWSATTPSIGLGFVPCQFTASGGGNTTVSEKRTFNTNGSYGLVAITSPATDKATNASTIGIGGSVTPGTAVTPQIQVNSGPVTSVTDYTIATGVFTPNTVTLAPGLNTVKIISNATTAVRNIIYDATTPDLTIQADSKPMPAKISGSIESSAKFTLAALNGLAPVAIPLSRITFEPKDQSGLIVWHVDLNGYVYNTISFTATDPAGNSSLLPYKNGIPTGDVDGDGTVRLADALAALRHVAGTEAIVDTDKFFNGDVGGLVQGHVSRDGVIDITDSVLILNKAYGLMDF